MIYDDFMKGLVTNLSHINEKNIDLIRQQNRLIFSFIAFTIWLAQLVNSYTILCQSYYRILLSPFIMVNNYGTGFEPFIMRFVGEITSPFCQSTFCPCCAIDSCRRSSIMASVNTPSLEPKALA